MRANSMISYKDMTYCINAPQCNNKDCHRRLTNEDVQAAKKLGLGISQASFAISCEVYEPVDKH